jgi:hypothetical protein
MRRVESPQLVLEIARIRRPAVHIGGLGRKDFLPLSERVVRFGTLKAAKVRFGPWLPRKNTHNFRNDFFWAPQNLHVPDLLVKGERRVVEGCASLCARYLCG